MRSNHNLQSLILNKNNLNTTFPFKDIILIIAASSSIKYLSLAHCHLTDYFGEKFAEGMKTNKGLEKFNFSGNDMTSKTLSHLSIALKEPQGSLREFNMGKNSLNDRGGIKLAEALKTNHNLVKINLSDNNFTDETAMAMNRNLIYNKKLEELNLAKNLINIRVLEMLQITLNKIHEQKLQTQIPEKMKEKFEFRNDR